MLRGVYPSVPWLVLFRICGFSFYWFLDGFCRFLSVEGSSFKAPKPTTYFVGTEMVPSFTIHGFFLAAFSLGSAPVQHNKTLMPWPWPIVGFGAGNLELPKNPLWGFMNKKSQTETVHYQKGNLGKKYGSYILASSLIPFNTWVNFKTYDSWPPGQSQPIEETADLPPIMWGGETFHPQEFNETQFSLNTCAKYDKLQQLN